MGEAFLYLYTWIMALMIFGTIFLGYVVVYLAIQSVRERRRGREDAPESVAPAPDEPSSAERRTS